MRHQTAYSGQVKVHILHLYQIVRAHGFYLLNIRKDLGIYFYHHESAYQHVKKTSKDKRNERASHNYYVVGHAEIRRCKVHEQRGGINTTMRRIDRDEHGWGQIPSALGVWRMLFVAQKGLAHPKGEMEGLVGWQLKGCLKQSWLGVWLRRRVRHVRVQVICDKDQQTRRTRPVPHTALRPVAARHT